MKKIILYILPLLFLIGCNSKTAEEYKAEAEASLKKNDVAKAISSYQNLVDEFPESESACEALYEIATLYQNKLVKDISPVQSMEKAAGNFRLVQERFPKNEKAPVALFMAAYINANELHKFQEATELYNLFLKKYPEHELAASAKQELEIMGLSPDDVLKQKTASGLNGAE